MSTDVLVKVPASGEVASGDKVPPIHIVTATAPEFGEEQILHKVHARPAESSPSPKSDVQKQPAARVSTPPSVARTLSSPRPRVFVKPKPKAKPKAQTHNSVQAFLNENPDFAAEFSQTIPISPKIAASDPEDLPAPTETAHRKRHRPVVEAEEVEEEELPEDEDEDLGEVAEEEEDVKPHRKQTGEEEEEEEDPDGVEDPTEGEDDVIPDTDEEAEAEAKRPSKPTSSPPKAEWGEALGHEADVFGSPVPDSDTPKPAKERKSSGGKAAREEETKAAAEPNEEEEAMEKMHLIEEIKENSSMGLVPPQPPSYNMPLKLLRQIKRFQEEKAAEIMTMGMMGTGLVSLVGMFEALNGRFDPFGKLFGRGLKLKGAKDSIEEKLDLYRVPFARMYRDMKKKGHNIEMPPWAQIVFITGGILKDVHMTNTYKEMQEEAAKEQEDPEALRRAQEMLRRRFDSQQREAAARAQSEADKRPYHADVATTTMSPQSDSEMEATLAQEFAGFDKLPSLESIASKRKDVISSTGVAPDPKVQTEAKAQQQQQPKVAEDVKFVHQVSEPGGAKIEMTHAASKEEDEEGEGGLEDEYEEDEGEDDDEAPIIQIPTVKPPK